jgi:hydroxymethylglutaryl-CoA synthase
MQDVGIISYGVCIPSGRVDTAAIAQAWGKDPAAIVRSLGVTQKSVAAIDQDSACLAVDATVQAQERALIDLDVGAVYVGSESHPYAVKPTAGIVAQALGWAPDCQAADLEFACKAGTAALQIVAAQVASRMVSHGVAIGSDTAQSAPGDALEYTAAAAATAYVLGSGPDVIATLRHTISKTYDIPDFWRREHETYPSHGGRFTGQPAYFRLVTEAVASLLEETGLPLSSFDHVVLHMPNAKFPRAAARRLGITSNQLATGFVVPDIGNTYSACSLVGLARVLDQALPGQRILLCSFGSGAGSDAFVWETTEALTAYQSQQKFGASVSQQIDRRRPIGYVEYAKARGKVGAS